MNLREELEKAVNENIQFEITLSQDFPAVRINNQWIKLHVPYDQILDTVIKALPEPEEPHNSNKENGEWFGAGQKSYRNDVVYLLQSAKSKEE
jgi:hypothetical protein